MIRPFLAALSFLTILPFPQKHRPGAEDLQVSVSAFPVVGLLIGGLAASVDLILRALLPSSVCGILVVLFLVIFTGALHLDGLADAADGLLGARSRQQVLEIMRDPRIGSFGVAAVAILLVAKASALSELSPPTRYPIIAVSPLIGRSSIVWVMRVLPYARERGIGFFFGVRTGMGEILSSILLPLALVPLLLGMQGIVICLCCLGATGLLMLWFWRKIGGWTGDTLGATSEIVEALSAVAALAARAMARP